MRVRGLHRQTVLLLWLTIWPLTIFPIGRAEQLPIKIYTTADGLARDDVNRIVRDSRGFLWFCTEEGLSRFDGYTFTNYTTEQGLPHRRATDLLETRGGLYWIATGGGVCLFDPESSGQMFITYCPSPDRRSQQINRLIEDHTGAIWCGTDKGLYRLQQQNNQATFESVDIGIPARPESNPYVSSILEDRRGALWVGTAEGLFRRLPDGRAERFTTQQGLPSNFVQSLLEDSQGRLWVGTRYGGLCLLAAELDPSQPVVARLYTAKDGLPTNWIGSLFESSDKRLWIGTTGGLSELLAAPPQSGRVFLSYARAQGLSDPEIVTIGEDREGSLWLGTSSGGAMKVAGDGFTTFGEADGLGSPRIASIAEDRRHRLCVVTTGTRPKSINQFDGRRFTAMPLAQIIHFPSPLDYGWGTNQVAFQDRVGEWWIETAKGLYRFPKVGGIQGLAHARPKAIYTSRNGLGGDQVFRLFEDSRGDIWVGTFGQFNHTLTRWERTTGVLHRYTDVDNALSVPTAFCEDASGAVWVGCYEGGLARCVGDHLTFFKEADGLPPGQIRALYRDRRGRLWIASSQGGLARLDEPAAARPHFITYTTAQGLASNDVVCITEDRWGRIYAGTGRALERLDPESGHIKHYTAADGLARGKVEVAFRDYAGALWFGTTEGLSRLIPGPDRPQQPPPIMISGLRIAGVTRHISEVGASEVSRLELSPNQNDIQIDYAGLNFGTGEMLHYQYELEGANADWSAPTDRRSVSYANLRPGNYRFIVRTINAEGLISPTPATVTFTILPPVWQRGWFMGLAAALLALVGYRLHRYRVSRLLELERVRTRIATDLHDDIGTSLSRMAILSEVVKQQGRGATPGAASILTEIADSARNLVDTMSDIVWSIDPRRDELSDLARKIREFASDVLEAGSIDWELQMPQEFDQIKLNPEQRRELFLIFKEALNNIARHANCRAVLLTIVIAHHQLSAEIQDDGCGFVAAAPMSSTTNGGSGHGLGNMQRRAALIGGHFSLHSSPGAGTRIRLTVPLKKT